MKIKRIEFSRSRHSDETTYLLGLSLGHQYHDFFRLLNIRSQLFISASKHVDMGQHHHHLRDKIFISFFFLTLVTIPAGDSYALVFSFPHHVPLGFPCCSVRILFIQNGAMGSSLFSFFFFFSLVDDMSWYLFTSTFVLLLWQHLHLPANGIRHKLGVKSMPVFLPFSPILFSMSVYPLYCV